MKTLRLYLTLSTIAVVGLSLFGGCYTQLALKDDEPEAVVDDQSSEILEPPLTGVILEPVYIPIAPPYCPPPFVGASPGAGTQPPAESPIRNIGNYRSDSGSSESATTHTRTSGSTRGGR